jgi:CRP-like cAMP-binding protein
LANSFGLERVVPHNPLTRQVHWITRDSEVERNYWAQCDKPAARFFIEANPGYGDGDGLVTLVKVDAHNLRYMLAAFFGERYERRKEAVMATLQRLPIGHQVLRPPEVIRRLRSTRLFASFDKRSLATLASTAQVLSLPSGKHVFRAGDPGDDMFVIARGAAYVLADLDGEDRIIDELATGALFGEIAMLGGERRSASLRTASSTILIKISRRALFSILDANPALGEVIWKNFAARRFDDCVRSLGTFKTMERAARLGVIEAGVHQQLADGESTTVDPSVILFVLLGDARVDQAGTSMVVRAPTLIDTKNELALTAQGTARIVRVPRPEHLPERALMSLPNRH